MTPDPAPDHIVIGIFADGAMLPFILSSTGMALQILENELFAFDLKTAVLARELLAPAALRVLYTTGKALLAAAPPATDIEPKFNDHRPTWDMTLADAIAVGTANDFMASAYLTSFGEEMRAVQVGHNGMPAAAYDAQMHETLSYLSRFQAEWGELFGEFAGYQARMAAMAELRAEFVG